MNYTDQSTYQLVDILIVEFSKSVERNGTIHNNEAGYAKFVQEFAKENGMTITGEFNRGAWNTRSHKFNTEEDAVIFKLKYGSIDMVDI